MPEISPSIDIRNPFGNLPLILLYLTIASGTLVVARTLSVLVKFALIVPSALILCQVIRESILPSRLTVNVLFLNAEFVSTVAVTIVLVNVSSFFRYASKGLESVSTSYNGFLLLIVVILKIVPLILKVWSSNTSILDFLLIFNLYGPDACLTVPFPEVAPDALNCVPILLLGAPIDVKSVFSTVNISYKLFLIILTAGVLV